MIKTQIDKKDSTRPSFYNSVNLNFKKNLSE